MVKIPYIKPSKACNKDAHIIPLRRSFDPGSCGSGGGLFPLKKSTLPTWKEGGKRWPAELARLWTDVSRVVHSW